MTHGFPSAARQLARSARALEADALPPAIKAKVEICLLDYFAGALTAGDLPWSRQAVALVRSLGGAPVASVIGTDLRTSCADAAFANAVQAHGLVQEDMHPPSSSHIGVVVLPAVLAVAEAVKAGGPRAIAGIVAGYETMGRLGRVIVDSDNARIFRPTGVLGPVAGAVAVARVLGLGEDETVNAIGFAGNQAVGLNQWPHEGTNEVFFHAGFAARNAVVSALLAQGGALAAESIIEGAAGMTRAYGGAARLDRLIREADGAYEIESVYHKPAPTCNFAQTACQAALAIVERDGATPGEIDAIEVRVAHAAAAYPGCDRAEPVESLIQAKTSIQYGVASVFVCGRIDDANFRAFRDPAIVDLASRTTVSSDAAFTAAFPRRQGAEVIVRRRDGSTLHVRLDDLRPLDGDGVRRRFRKAAEHALGARVAQAIERSVASLAEVQDVGALMRLLSVPESSR